MNVCKLHALLRIAMTIFKRYISACDSGKMCWGSSDLEYGIHTNTQTHTDIYRDDSKTVDVELMLYRYAIITRITRIKLHKLIYERGLCFRIDWFVLVYVCVLADTCLVSLLFSHAIYQISQFHKHLPPESAIAIMLNSKRETYTRSRYEKLRQKNLSR